MKALKPPSYTDQKGRVRDGFYPLTHPQQNYEAKTG
jgi:hypothetical protein